MILSAKVMRRLVVMKTMHVTFQEMYLNNGYGNGDENGEDQESVKQTLLYSHPLNMPV